MNSKVPGFPIVYRSLKTFVFNFHLIQRSKVSIGKLSAIEFIAD